MKTQVLEKLWLIIEDRKNNPSEGSYTCKMLKDRKKLEGKIIEECKELIETEKTEGKDSVKWEAADLIYHLMVYLSSKGVEFNDVLLELEDRMSKKSER